MVDQVLGLNENGLEQALVTQAQLLEETDISTVLSTIQVDEFSDLFAGILFTSIRYIYCRSYIFAGSISVILIHTMSAQRFIFCTQTFKIKPLYIVLHKIAY